MDVVSIGLTFTSSLRLCKYVCKLKAEDGNYKYSVQCHTNHRKFLFSSAKDWAFAKPFASYKYHEMEHALFCTHLMAMTGLEIEDKTPGYEKVRIALCWKRCPCAFLPAVLCPCGYAAALIEFRVQSIRLSAEQIKNRFLHCLLGNFSTDEPSHTD